MKIFSKIKYVISQIFINKEEKLFLQLFKNSLVNQVNQCLPSRTILVQMPESYYFLIVFSLILNSLKKKYRLKIKWINVNCEHQRSGSFQIIKRTKFFERKWQLLYTANGGDVAFSNIYYRNNMQEDVYNSAVKSFQSLKSRSDLLELSFEGIRVGDLVYDTYLRFKPAPTVDINDLFLKRIIISAFHIVRDAFELHKKNNIDLLLTSYCTYIQHGIMVRVAAVFGVKIVGAMWHNQLLCSVNPNLLTTSKEFVNYKSIIDGLDEQQLCAAREIARKSYLERFQGGFDNTLVYMSRSAYSEPLINEDVSVFKKTGKKRLVIFLHCFFDSPHLFRWMLYDDFYQWVYRTLECANYDKFDYYVKPHPNAVLGNDEIVDLLKEKFPKAFFLPKHVKNNQLIDEGFEAAVTVYGTLGHELPYFGIPVVSAGDNPHERFSFCLTINSRETYENYIKNIDKIPKPSASAKKEILEYYYMHNVYKFPGSLSNKKFNELYLEFVTIDNSKKLEEFANKCLNDKDYFNKLVNSFDNAVNEVVSE